MDSNSISEDCKRDEGSLNTGDWTECMKYCNLEKCNGFSSLTQNGKCHCINDSCVPANAETNYMDGDATIMTSKCFCCQKVIFIFIEAVFAMFCFQISEFISKTLIE